MKMRLLKQNHMQKTNRLLTKPNKLNKATNLQQITAASFGNNCKYITRKIKK